MKQITVKELWLYPVKGCQGIAVDSLSLTESGITGDRLFAIWTEGKLVDQKDTPIVASIAAQFDVESGTLQLTHPDKDVFKHTVVNDGDKLDTLSILDQYKTIDQGDSVANWLSAILEKSVRLVTPGPVWKINFPIPDFERIHDSPKDRFYAASTVSLANVESLNDLNSRLSKPVPMDRFRINIIVDGIGAFEEDHIDSIVNDDVEITQVTPTERCVIITTDQKTGERPKSDLMQTLSNYRRKPKEQHYGSGVIFGNYMTVSKAGNVRIGDKLNVNEAAQK